ncbi:MAG: hypothetical protein QGG09_22120 [Pirellulaceae bacterium]|jgi:hypothetical protein|nr:hypothetical protein [Pirellulaceae bacterium]HJN09056.1 hypothetical protein [Pirellulaceae bacterium]
MKTFRPAIIFSLPAAFLLLAATGVLAQQGAKPLAPVASGDWNERTAAHLLDRAGFGGTPQEIAELAALSPQQAVGRMVNYQRVVQDQRLQDFQIQPYEQRT